ncbi:PolC-type DNA polymerase III [Bacillus salacetis]|uniref:3'-5' exonuclease n=1 Tax=Bacillus salacetis TaxID=2315464 RepID=UPI003BA36C69
MIFFYTRKKAEIPLLNEKIPLSTPIDNLNFIVFDTETTGFHVNGPDRLIEIAAVKVKGTRVIQEDTFQSFVNPHRQISREITRLTGITEEDTMDAPDSKEAVESFREYVKEAAPVCLVGHYVSFDVQVLKSEYNRNSLALQNPKAIDTLNLIGYLAPSKVMRDLERYAQDFGTRIYPRHRAINDALTTAYLFSELLLLLKDRGINTWGDLSNISP